MYSTAGRTSLAICLLLLTACSALVRPNLRPDGKYDFSFALFNGGLEDIAKDWPRIFASGKPVTINKADQQKTEHDLVQMTGRALVIYPYVLALYHSVNVAQVQIPMFTPQGFMTMQMPADEVREEQHWLLESKDAQQRIFLQKIAAFPEEDFALFKMPDSAAPSHPTFTFGKSGELKIGNVAFILGSPHLWGAVIRPGIVSAFGADLALTKEQSEALGQKDAIVLSIAVIGGDSGSPVLALRGGKPELVGLVNAKINETLGSMIALDSMLEKIKTRTGIDLRAVNESNIKMRGKK